MSAESSEITVTLPDGTPLGLETGATGADVALAGDTVFAWSEVLDKAPLAERDDCGALRLRLVATKNRPCHDYPLRDTDGRYLPDVLLDLDYWGLMPTRAALSAGSGGRSG